MRSYKDCLIEYIEERGFSELTSSWFFYLKKQLQLGNSSFQLIEGATPVDTADTISVYADQIPSAYLVHSPRSNRDTERSYYYGELIRELILNEFKGIQSQTNQKLDGVKLCESLLYYQKSDYASSFSKAFKKCLLASGFSKTFIRSFLRDVQEDRSLVFQAIESYYDLENSYLKIPKYGVQSTTDLVGTLAVDFDSHCLNQGAEDEREKQAVIPHSSFLQGHNSDVFSSINSKAKLSPIKVSGELYGLKKITMQAGKWFNEDLIRSLFGNKYLKGGLEFSFQKELKESFKQRFNAFYTYEEFDLTIEVQNEFSDYEIEQLRNYSFTLFPLNLSDDHHYFKWIDRNKEGALRIRIKSKQAQTTLLGANVEELKK